MHYGKLGAKNFAGVVASIVKFCDVESAADLGHRDAAVLRVCCDLEHGQVYDIDVSMYLGDRMNGGRFAEVTPLEGYMEQVHIGMLGRRLGLNTKETTRARRMSVKYSDFIGFSLDNCMLLICDKHGTKLDFLVRLRLRDIYALRLNNITERVANCLAMANEIVLPKVDRKWTWTRKLICLAALECLLRAVNLWEKEDMRDEYRNEAAIKLMLGDMMFSGTEVLEGLDEYNMYSNDAEQRVRDSELLVNCGLWLENGGTEVASGLRASDLTQEVLTDWKDLLDRDLGISLPPLTKQGEMRRSRIRAAPVLI